MTFVCKLEFVQSAPGVTSKTIDFMRVRQDKYNINTPVYGGFKWSRNINKNAIYVQLPVGNGAGSSTFTPVEEGGYGYDLGFVQDNFVLDVKTTDYKWYNDIVSLIKANTGEVTAYLTIGDTASGTIKYNVLVRYCNFTSDESGSLITISVTLTVVSKEYAPV